MNAKKLKKCCEKLNSLRLKEEHKMLSVTELTSLFKMEEIPYYQVLPKELIKLKAFEEVENKYQFQKPIYIDKLLLALNNSKKLIRDRNNKLSNISLEEKIANAINLLKENNFIIYTKKTILEEV